MNFRLRGDQLPNARIAKEPAQLPFVCALNDKIAIKIRLPNLDILHPEHFAQFTENLLPINLIGEQMYNQHLNSRT